MTIAAMLLPALLAGLVQGVTGFGAGVLLMLFYPLLFSVAQSSAMSQCLCTVLCLSVLLRYRRSIRFRHCVLPLVFYFPCYFLALQQAVSMNTDALKPVLGLFLGKKPPRTTVFSVALAVVGLYLLSCMGVSRINKGDLYLMGCALAFSVQITCIDRLAGNLDGLRMNCIQALVVTVLSVPFILLTKETVVFSDITACWFPLIFSGVLSMGVAYTLQIVGQQGLEPTTASLIMSLESVFAALGGWLILHQTMTPWELLGCGLVFAGVVLSQLPVGIFAKKA